ncbi:TonB-dependent receptor [Elizabethkingia meningoseptica]|uniref:TonB-dependent receptor n=1 Tax=Elizabethkingia meningoseptica TaxID=238 RepID=UPI0023B02866|nr:TonB-dependent receptor [Elizabethkingia meningoseptica]MDE5492191.1 TonB-dependent receptor [Elizabethkingia meningoseptica]
MNPRDPLNDIFKKLEHSESNDLSAKEKVWARLEKQLDQPEKKQPKEFSLNKTWLAAAAIVLVAGVSYLFFKPAEQTAPIVAQQSVMEKPEPNTQASEIPQTIAQNNITKGQVDKIKEEKKNLSVTKETIAYQDAKDLRKEGTPPSSAPQPATAGALSSQYTAPMTMSAPIVKNYNKETLAPSYDSADNTKAEIASKKSVSSLNETAAISSMPTEDSFSLTRKDTELRSRSVSKRVVASVLPDSNLTINNDIGMKNSLMQIRGSGKSNPVEPFVWDINGMVLRNDNPFMKSFDSNKIESIQVIKGTTAIEKYGSIGKNGVILVKTKKLSRKEKKELKIQALNDSIYFTRDSLK